MSQNLSNQQYLLADQYHNASKLNARIQLHECFSTNTYDWHRWVFDHFKLPVDSRILELGCGPATLWQKNSDRIPEGWQITLSDFSQGMLEEAQKNLASLTHPFTFQVIDAQDIYFPDNTFDAVIANHMLYHVPDRAKAISEIYRVLKSGGHFFAATNGEKHLQEMPELVQAFSPDVHYHWDKSTSTSFRLETGHAELSRHFPFVTLHEYENALVVTEAEPLAAFILSTPVSDSLQTPEAREALTHFLQQKIETDGSILISKATGLFEAIK